MQMYFLTLTLKHTSIAPTVQEFTVKIVLELYFLWNPGFSCANENVFICHWVEKTDGEKTLLK